MDINAKIKLIAETMSGYTILVDSSNGANVQLSKIAMPCILVFIQDTGEVLSTNSHYRDSVNIRVAFLNKMPKGFKESDVETMRYELKQDMFILFHKLKFDFQFKTNTESLRYEIVYDEFDDNLLGVVFNDNIKERVGLNLSCDVPDSHGELPSSPSFCQKVSECSSIISINEMLDSLQQQIDDLPTTTGVQSVTGPNVDNTNTLNPVVLTPSLQAVITESSTVDGVIAQSLNGLSDIGIEDTYVQTNVNDGTNFAQHTVQATQIGATVNGTGLGITDGNIDFATPSLTKNSVEVATVNDIVQVTTGTIGAAINGAASATPNNTDLVMSVESSVAKKNTWTQIKAFLKTYFDTIYQSKHTIIDYSATSTYSGWSSFTIRKVFGIDYPLYTIWTVEVSGTSDSAFATVTLPVAQGAAYPNISIGSLVTNNGINSAVGRVQLLAGGNVIQWAATAGGGGFTASGTKTVRFQGIQYK